MKSCQVEGCVLPSWGKDKKTGIRYCKTHQSHRTDLDRRSPYEKHMAKSKENTSKSNTASKVRGLATLPVNKEMASKFDVRSQLLLLADKLFGNFIKKRDADEHGNIICPCCNNPFHINETNGDGKKIVQPLHFVVRDIYSQRFNENQVFAGCGYCNLKMHLNPTGKEYLNYRAFLVKRLGNEVVTEIEDDKYKINKLPTSQIQSVIDKYKS